MFATRSPALPASLLQISSIWPPESLTQAMPRGYALYFDWRGDTQAGSLHGMLYWARFIVLLSEAYGIFISPWHQIISPLIS